MRARVVRRRLAMAVGWLAPVLILLAPASAAAHPAQVAYARIDIGERAVEIALSMNLFELDLVLTLDRELDGTVSPAELDGRRAEIADYLRGKTAGTTAGRGAPSAGGRGRLPPRGAAALPHHPRRAAHRARRGPHHARPDRRAGREPAGRVPSGRDVPAGARPARPRARVPPGRGG